MPSSASVARWRVGEHRVGQVRAADRLAPAGAPRAGIVELEAQLAQLVGHRVDPADAVGAEVVERGQQRLVGVVELVAEDVQVLVRAVDGGELDGRAQVDAVARGCRERLGHAVDRVVVGQREQLTPASARVGDHFAAGSAPSEWVECDCRSKVGGWIGSLAGSLPATPSKEVPMTTGAIIAIVVVALIIIALFAFVLPRMRRKARDPEARARAPAAPRARGGGASRRGRLSASDEAEGRAAGADRPDARPRPSARRPSCMRSVPACTRRAWPTTS